jgi:hypothetical protein
MTSWLVNFLPSLHIKIVGRIKSWSMGTKQWVGQVDKIWCVFGGCIWTDHITGQLNTWLRRLQSCVQNLTDIIVFPCSQHQLVHIALLHISKPNISTSISTVLLPKHPNGTFVKERKIGAVQSSWKVQETFPVTHMAQAENVCGWQNKRKPIPENN